MHEINQISPTRFLSHAISYYNKCNKGLFYSTKFQVPLTFIDMSINIQRGREQNKIADYSAKSTEGSAAIFSWKTWQEVLYTHQNWLEDSWKFLKILQPDVNTKAILWVFAANKDFMNKYGHGQERGFPYNLTSHLGRGVLSSHNQGPTLQIFPRLWTYNEGNLKCIQRRVNQRT